MNVESENKFQSLYYIDKSATENDFSTLKEDANFGKNQSVIPKSTRRPQMVFNNHPEKQTVFVNNKVVPGEASYTTSIKTGRKQLKKLKTVIFGKSIGKGICHKEFNQMLKKGSAQFKIFLGCNSKALP